MKKEELKKLLDEGKKIDEIFDLSLGQDCLIYKGTWPEDVTSSEVIYIPDIWLNELNSSEVSAEEKLGCMYTAEDFLAEANGNVALAKDLFMFCDWQNPTIQDLVDCTTDEEAQRLYGSTWEEILK